MAISLEGALIFFPFSYYLASYSAFFMATSYYLVLFNFFDLTINEAQVLYCIMMFIDLLCS
jgi:hypothetical protein